ncbi:shTK domain protein [Necator americanus]|uniref:ShTK domain protein n=1 Tax=Necator americanus TaxID=51031 RepID=W2SY60_NECAM|nr:shTK domain protein [Necator americanus]ETN73796.1 shTK domain protein [Necator americanus]
MPFYLVAVLLFSSAFTKEDDDDEPLCKDRLLKSECAWFKQKNYCEGEDLAEFLETRCPKTCDICARLCKDRWRTEFCQIIKDKGNCAVTKATVRTMRANCTKTCGHCDELLQKPPRRRIRPKRRRG